MSNKKAEKKAYGEFGNVMLTDEDVEVLKQRFPDLYERYIEEVDGYCESTGKKYKNYRATIQNWIRRDRQSGKLKSKRGDISRKPTYDLKKIAAAAEHNTEIKYR